ncbi:MAG: hypothetical protein HYY06_04300 [Deltaproteobacteria bacterium]|nr:hypothetical protein [Deltaproteobacteria bacterium]
MPVRKFRSVEEMTAPVEARPYDPANLRAAIALSRTCIRLSRRRPSPGVRKFRSIEEANEARQRLDDSSGAGS